MSVAFKFYDFAMAAGAPQVLPVSGTYFRILSCTGSVYIRLQDGSIAGPFAAGQGLKNQKFDALILIDASGAANKGVIIIAGADFVDDRITGEVSVIDGEKARTLAGSMLSAAPFKVASAAQLAMVQIWNPSTTKNLILSQISYVSTVANGVNIYSIAATLATDITGVSAGNKLLGGAFGIAQIRADYQAALPVFANNLLHADNLVAFQNQPWKPTGNIVVKPSTGLVISATVVNTQISANFEWFEETI